jgi:hypothetical protein
METIKFKKDRTSGAIHCILGGRKYKPYLIGNLPSLFAFIYDANNEKDGITGWFNYKGITYVPA